MNDIEILEKLQNIFKKLRKDDEEGHSSAYELQWEDMEAIENLIQRNKDLEQIEKEHKEENGRLREKIKELEKYKKYYDNEKIVWSRKKDTRIDKIKELLHSYSTDDARFKKYLQEILEESEK